ncbi:ninjurin-2 isoform X1 [Folsomia candida]|uniref:ninjurin-2 isoform X1 n=1 Tax=Folsomia candida TaxID=158441 RepID=UPI000B8F11FD|nr:ninjurin-2 isoform X1 [Folsomia candida]
MTEVLPMTEVSSDEKSSRYPTTMNVNRYATKKTIAQGMLDIALLTANASQLKYVLQVGKERHPFYTLMVTLISISIVLQVTVGICFLFIGSLNINKPKSQRTADILNNLITLQIFIITTINVVISSFGIEHVIIEEDKYNKKSGLVRRETPQIFETGQAVQFFANSTINTGRILFDESSL